MISKLDYRNITEEQYIQLMAEAIQKAAEEFAELTREFNAYLAAKKADKDLTFSLDKIKFRPFFEVTKQYRE